MQICERRMLQKSFWKPGIMRSNYRGRIAALVTKHEKERAVARPLHAALGVTTVVPGGIDTDTLGTFTGEVERRGSPREVALEKARLGTRDGHSIVIASEGSFGPHPFIPFLASHHELLALVDRELGIELVESLFTEETNFNHCTAGSAECLGDFLQRVGFPTHGLIVRPNDGVRPDHLFKGIRNIEDLSSAIARCAVVSTDGLAHVETDMRAHMNPTRMRVIRRLAFQLARRLLAACPQCNSPGWGRVGVKHGLPCSLCGSPTQLVAFEIWGCARCDHRIDVPRIDKRQEAEPGECSTCNP